MASSQSGLGPYWFDMDGTLVDTTRALIAAYEYAGVIAPAGKLHLPWRDWCTPMQHDRKNAAYEYFLRKHANPMPLLKWAVDNQSPVLTAASSAAVLAVQRAFNVILRVSVHSATTHDKIRTLNTASANGVTGTYVDDDPEARYLMCNRTPWRVIAPQVAQRELL